MVVFDAESIADAFKSVAPTVQERECKNQNAKNSIHFCKSWLFAPGLTLELTMEGSVLISELVGPDVPK
jgi:hypothetical protein